MSRPLRIEFNGALYHITSRGNARSNIYLIDAARYAFLNILDKVCQQYNWTVHAYCLMTNHYHLLVETPDGNLCKGMRQLNGVYTQKFNHLHNRVGHIYQGRYKAIIVQRETYLLELARYIVLNPVRARMVRSADQWPWSSYRSCAAIDEIQQQYHWLLSCFGDNETDACSNYRDFVAGGLNQPSPFEDLKNQIFLGNEAFVENLRYKIDTGQDLSEIPMAQMRKAPQALEYYDQNCNCRDDAILAAYKSGGYSLKQVGDFYGLHYSRVSRIIKMKGAKGKT